MITRLLAAVVLTLAACGGDDGGSEPAASDDGSTFSGTEIVIEFEDGTPTRDVWREDVPLGDPVSILVAGDRDEQVHVHGYDLYIEPDEPDTTLEFDALIPGRFEIELEQSGRLILEITVS